jgi:hypothetical protein
MKLREFNRSIKSGYSKDDLPRIRISGRSGLITFNHSAVQRLKLKAGEGLTFHNDEEQLTDWYLKIGKKEDAFILRQYKETYGFSCTALAHEMLRSMLGVQESKKSVSFLISGKPYEGYHAILAKSKA